MSLYLLDILRKVLLCPYVQDKLVGINILYTLSLFMDQGYIFIGKTMPKGME